jgi:hypothetical protein
MKRNDVFALVASAGLVASYIAVAPAIVTADVGKSYRKYFITHQVVEWQTSSYKVPISQGVFFSRNGKPTFVRSMQGIARPEDHGRWTDARLAPQASIRYKDTFDGAVCVLLKAAPSQANLGAISYVRMGSASLAFKTSSKTGAWYRFSFSLISPTDTVQVYPGTSQRMSASDPRRIGINLMRLIVLPGNCP